jgi:hypothetical protein
VTPHPHREQTASGCWSPTVAENALGPVRIAAQLRLEVDGAGLAGMEVSRVVALRGPCGLALTACRPAGLGFRTTCQLARGLAVAWLKKWVRHEAMVFRTEVRDLCLLVVAAAR